MLRSGLVKSMCLGVAALIALGAGLAASAPDAEAAFALRLDDGTTTTTVLDNGSGDGSSTSGTIIYSGSIGVWGINVTTGISGSPLSSPYPHLSLNSVNVTSTGGGTLTIMLSDTDFSSTSSLAAFMSAFAGLTGGTVTFQAYINTDNTLFSTAGTQLCNFGPYTVGGFSTSCSGYAALSGAYSITLVATITHTGAFQLTGLHGDIQIPEPQSLAMFGVGLLGLGGLLARRRRSMPVRRLS